MMGQQNTGDSRRAGEGETGGYGETCEREVN